MATLSMDEIVKQYEDKYKEAQQANEKRYKQGLSILNEAIARYQPGGGFGAGAEAAYEQGKTKAMSSGMQNLVSSGLANTTVAAGLPLAYEQEVGTPFRLQLEDMRMQNLTQAEQAKAGFIQARQDTYPDQNMFSQLTAQAASGGGGTSYGGWGGWGSSGGRYMNPEPFRPNNQQQSTQRNVVYGSSKAKDFWATGY